MKGCLVTADLDTAYPARLAPGAELLGEMKDSGFAEPGGWSSAPTGR